MAIQDAEFRGEVRTTMRDHGRRLTVVEDDVDELKQDAAAHRARVGLISGFSAAAGAGLVTLAADLIAKALGH